MRVNKKGVSPRDRRIDRRKVAIVAAVAALFLFAASPAMAVTYFDVVPGLSFQSQSIAIDATELGAGSYITSPQFAGSDTTSLYGGAYVDLTAPGFINLSPFAGSSSIGYAIGAPGAGGTPGLYAPKDPITTDPPFPPVGLQPGSNYGVATPGPLYLTGVYWGLAGSLATAGPKALAGTSFTYVPGVDALVGYTGRLAYTSALGGDSSDVVGDPLAAFGTAGVTPGSWDPADLTAGPLGTLSLPIESSFSIAIDTGDILPGSHVYTTFASSGIIVLTPRVPEPSSIVLAGMGVVGLLTCGWRLRKRKA